MVGTRYWVVGAFVTGQDLVGVPAPLSDRVTRWHFIGGHLLTKEMPILLLKRMRQGCFVGFL